MSKRGNKLLSVTTAYIVRRHHKLICCVAGSVATTYNVGNMSCCVLCCAMLFGQVTTYTNIDTFRRQLKMLGFSYDWDRELATTGEREATNKNIIFYHICGGFLLMS